VRPVGYGVNADRGRVVPSTLGCTVIRTTESATFLEPTGDATGFLSQERMQPQGSEGSSSLTRFVVSNHQPDVTLQHVAELATREIIGCDLAGITLLRDAKPVTAVFTDPKAPEIDTAQYETGKGPCLDAFREALVFRIDDTGDESRWPEFAAAANAAGVLSTLSMPLVVGDTALGALNLYSYDRDAFVDDETAWVFALQAAVVLANSQAYWAAQALTAQLEQALSSRAVIEQAKGILMLTLHCSEDAAFAELRTRSQHANRKVREIAFDIVDAAKNHPAD
jgi:GAF domain-containing protein